MSEKKTSIKLLWLAFAGTLNLLTHLTASLHHTYTLVIVNIIHPIFMWSNYHYYYSLYQLCIYLASTLIRSCDKVDADMRQSRYKVDTICLNFVSTLYQLWKSLLQSFCKDDTLCTNLVAIRYQHLYTFLTKLIQIWHQVHAKLIQSRCKRNCACWWTQSYSSRTYIKSCVLSSKICLFQPPVTPTDEHFDIKSFPANSKTLI